MVDTLSSIVGCNPVAGICAVRQRVIWRFEQIMTTVTITKTITGKGFECGFCSHRWIPRHKKNNGQPKPPKVCPNCKRTDWNFKEKES